MTIKLPLAIGVFAAAMSIATVSYGQRATPPQPAQPAGRAQPAAPASSTQSIPADPETREIYKRIAQGLDRVVQAQEQGRKSLQEKLNEVQKGLNDFDKAEAYVNEQIEKLNQLVNELKPDSDFVKAIAEVEGRARQLAVELEIDKETKEMAADARKQQGIAAASQKRAAEIRKALYDEITRVEGRKKVIVAARRVNSLSIMNQAISAALTDADKTLQETRQFADLVNQLPVATVAQ